MAKKPAPKPQSLLIKRINNNKRYLILILASFLIGIFWLASVRFFLVKSDEVHFHSNFAVYIEGVKEDFKSFTYYEEVAACSGAYDSNPKGRTHMHDNVNNVIHVHDKRVTYADFFNNLDWTLGPDFVRNDRGIITNTAEKQWVFILNDEMKTRVDNLIIGDQDKLLISYGPQTTDFIAQYDQIENKAEEHDSKQDPGSCKGLTGMNNDSLGSRVKRALWFD